MCRNRNQEMRKKKIPIAKIIRDFKKEERMKGRAQTS